MAEENMLAGTVAVVTGAGRGIGRAFAMLMARHGAKVLVNDLGGSVSGEGEDTGPAYEVVNEIRGAGGEAVMNTDSVTDWDAAHAIVQQAVDEFGRIDIVINNAGILRDRIFHRMTEEDWDSVINVHLKGTFNISRAAADHFQAQESGVFMHMTSTSGLIGNFGQANYAAAKLGIAGLSKSIALDAKPGEEVDAIARRLGHRVAAVAAHRHHRRRHRRGAQIGSQLNTSSDRSSG